MNSLLITMLRNIILFIPCVILLNALVGLKGAIAAQPIVETLLAGICLIMAMISRRRRFPITVISLPPTPGRYCC